MELNNHEEENLEELFINNEDEEYQLEFNDNVAEVLGEQNKILSNLMSKLNNNQVKLKKMFFEIKKIKSETIENKNKTQENLEIIENVAADIDVKYTELNDKLDNRIFISDGEIANLYNILTDKSIYIAKCIDWKKYYPKCENFGQACGQIRKTLWSMLNRRCGVNKYIRIRYLDYDMAVEYANSLTVNDFFKRKGIYH